MAMLHPARTGHKTSIRHNIPDNAELRRLFDAVPLLERYRVADLVLGAASRVISKEAKNMIKPGTEINRRKRSAAQRKSADWETHLRDTITHVVRKGKGFNRGGGIAYIGPRWEGKGKARGGAGSKIYLVYEWDQATRKQMWWGHKGDPEVVRKKRNVMVDAANRTRSAQQAVMKAVLIRELHIMFTETWRF